MDAARSMIAQDAFAKLAGIELVSLSAGHAVVEMKVGPQHLNGLGIVHGGAVFTLADFAFAAASNSHGTVAVAISANINFVKAAQGGSLKAEARETSLNPKLGTYSVDVTDQDGALIAVFQGVVYRKKDPIRGV